jgi:hypothetical protein
VKILRLFSNSEYIDIVFAYGEVCGSSPRAQKISVRLLVYIVIDTIEILRERVENAATTIRNNRGMFERMEELFRRGLHYCIDNNGGHFK